MSSAARLKKHNIIEEAVIRKGHDYAGKIYKNSERRNFKKLEICITHNEEKSKDFQGCIGICHINTKGIKETKL